MVYLLVVPTAQALLFLTVPEGRGQHEMGEVLLSAHFHHCPHMHTQPDTMS